MSLVVVCDSEETRLYVVCRRAVVIGIENGERGETVPGHSARELDLCRHVPLIARQ